MPEINQYSETSWIGWDRHTNPAMLPQGVCQILDDAVVEGPATGGPGKIVTRQSLVGKLTSLTGNPLYLLLTWKRSNGTTSGLVATNGTLKVWDKGATSLTAVTLPGSRSTVTAASAFAARFGKYIFVTDSTGAMLRMDVDSPTTASLVTSLTAPTPAPGVALTNITVDALNNASETSLWGSDILTTPGAAPPWVNGSAQVGPDPTFAAMALYPTTYGPGHAGGGGPVGGFDFTLNIDFHDAPAGDARVTFPNANFTGRWALFDDPLGGFYTDAYITNQALTNEGSSNCARLAIVFGYYSSDTSGQSGVDIVVDGFNGTTKIATLSKTVRFPYNASPTGGETLYTVFDLSDQVPPGTSPQITQWKYSIAANGANVGGSNVLLKEPSVYFLPGDWAAVSYSGGAGLTFTHTETYPNVFGAVAGTRLIKNYGTNQAAFAGYNTLVFSLAGSSVSRYIQNGISFKVGFRASGSTTTSYSNPVTFSADGAYAFVDVSTVSSSLRASFRYLELLFDGNIDNASADTSFAITAIKSAGNKSIGTADYNYIVTTLAGTPFAASEIDSPESSASVLVTPTTLTAAVNVTAPAVPSADSGVVTYFQIWVAGGTSNDGLTQYYRLIATVPVGSDVTYGADTATYGTTGNPYISWNHTTRVLLDNTPDSFIVSAPILAFGKNAPPSAPETVTSYGARLVLTQGPLVYFSWLQTSPGAAALYFTAINLSTALDPYASSKGATFQIGAPGDNDPVQRAINHETELIVFKQNSVHIVSGDDASNFSQRQYHGAYENVGLLSRRGIALFNAQGVDELWFMGPDSLYRWTGNQIIHGPDAVQNDLYPFIAGGTAITPSVLAQSALVVADGRLMIIAPRPPSEATDTVSTVILILDRRTGGWVRWTKGPFAGFTTGAVFASPNDSSEIVFATTDGQLALYGGYTGDKATPASSAQNVALTFKSRTYGQQEGSGLGFFGVDVPQYLFWDIAAGESCTATFTVTGDVAAAAQVDTFALTTGAIYEDPIYLGPDNQGSNISVTIAVPSKAKTTLRGYLLQTIEGLRM
jgi:hypothetical protein